MKTIQEIGLELREKRKDENIDINVLADEMRISKNILLLVEDGKYKESNVKVRLIYKKYIQKLGLDYKDYEEDIKFIFPNVVEETINLSQDEILDEIKVKKKFKINKSLLSVVVIFIFVVVLSLLTVYNFNNNVVDYETINETTILPNKVLIPESIIEPDIPTIEVKKASDNNVEVYLESLKDVTVEIDATQEVYYDYSKNNIIVEQGTVLPGENKKLKFDDVTSIVLNIGNLSNTKIYINDYEITQDLGKELGTQNNITFKEAE